MIATPSELTVSTRGDYDRLPNEGRWEVANGYALLTPAPLFWHQELSDALVQELRRQVRVPNLGYVASAVTVFIPVPPSVLGDVQSRIPDIVVTTHRPPGTFEVGGPPDWVIEILSTRRGNVELTEKMDDYARAGIQEYWVVNPVDRIVEVYALSAGDYTRVQRTVQPQSISFPGVQVDLTPLWPEERLT